MMEQTMAQRNQAVSLKPGKTRAALTITHPNAADVDIGSAAHFVAVPPDRDDEPVREFPSFTVDLNAIADWLTACRVDTVAMESTGVYWIPLFEPPPWPSSARPAQTCRGLQVTSTLPAGWACAREPRSQAAR